MCIRVLFFASRRRHTRYWRDWSSDVCSSDLTGPGPGTSPGSTAPTPPTRGCTTSWSTRPCCRSRDRKSVVWGKSVDLGGRRIIKKKKKKTSRRGGAERKQVNGTRDSTRRLVQ